MIITERDTRVASTGGASDRTITTADARAAVESFLASRPVSAAGVGTASSATGPTATTVEEMLRALGLHEALWTRFQSHDLTEMDILAELSKQDLKDIGLTIGQAAKVAKAAKAQGPPATPAATPGGQGAEQLQAQEQDASPPAPVQVGVATGLAQAQLAPPVQQPDAASDTDDAQAKAAQEAAHAAEEKLLKDAAAALGLAEADFNAHLKQWNQAAFDPARQADAKAEEAKLLALARKLDAAAKKRAEELLKELKRKQQEALERWRKAEAERIAKLQKEQDEQRRKAAQRLEEERQRQLQVIGQCVAGYRWIHQGGGYYVCAGGTHSHQF